MSGGSSAAASMADDDHNHENDLAALDVSIIISGQDRKEQALQVLKSDLMEKLDKEVKSLDEDSWMFEGSRSRINLISRPGGLGRRPTEIPAQHNMARQK